MKLLTRQEYNLILRSLDYYDFKNKTIKDFTDGITVNYNGCF